MNTETDFSILSENYEITEPVEPSLEDVKKAVEILDGTDCMHPTECRFQALNTLKAATDRVKSDFYSEISEKGLCFPQPLLPALYEQFPSMYWYDHAFQKVLDGVKNDAVPEGQVFIWMAYNMGYVIKTPTSCFSIDLHHRRSEELAPFLDFCCVTHNHDDHYIPRFTLLMDRLRKPVVTNFMPNAGYEGVDGAAGYSKAPTRTLDFGDVVLTTFESDHNHKLRGFVQPVQAVCRTGNRTCVIYSSGDTCDASQLNVNAGHLDFWMVHPYVGMQIQDGAARLRPEMTLVSHIAEFTHRVGRYRWTWRQGYLAAQKVWNLGLDAVVPAWGDRIVWG